MWISISLSGMIRRLTRPTARVTRTGRTGFDLLSHPPIICGSSTLFINKLLWYLVALSPATASHPQVNVFKKIGKSNQTSFIRFKTAEARAFRSLLPCIALRRFAVSICTPIGSSGSALARSTSVVGRNSNGNGEGLFIQKKQNASRFRRIKTSAGFLHFRSGTVQNDVAVVALSRTKFPRQSGVLTLGTARRSFLKERKNQIG